MARVAHRLRRRRHRVAVGDERFLDTRQHDFAIVDDEYAMTLLGYLRHGRLSFVPHVRSPRRSA